jgi:hypothetical protein
VGTSKHADGMRTNSLLFSKFQAPSPKRACSSDVGIPTDRKDTSVVRDQQLLPCEVDDANRGRRSILRQAASFIRP